MPPDIDTAKAQLETLSSWAICRAAELTEAWLPQTEASKRTDTKKSGKDEETEADDRKPLVDPGRFEIRWQGKICELGNTMEFKLFERLNRWPGHYFSVNTLLDDIWPDRMVEPNTVQVTASNLRKKLRNAKMADLVIDGSQKGHYGLKLPE